MYYSPLGYKTSIFLLTRFNLILFPKDKEGLSTKTEKWLVDRFRLFDKYCFPSILNQSYKGFIWIVLFDDKTPEKYKKKIISYQDQMKNFLPVYFGSEEAKSYNSYVNQVISEHKDESSLLITARVDNDDALHRDFIKNVALLKDNRDELIHFFSFGIGLQYYEETNLSIKLRYIKNHFLVAVSNMYDKENAKNILEFFHDIISDYGIPFDCIINKEPMWVEVVHKHNVNNDCIMTLLQKPVYDDSILQQDFNWDIKLDRSNTRKRFFFFFIPHFCFQFLKKVKMKLIGRIFV